ncbi:MAG: hypothetical protein HY855_01310 [Burkholderiales bacterium]|nr:hypothetical protein [Burkholderiales bacterium]
MSPCNARLACAIALLASLAACGGGSNPLDNPPQVANPATAGGQKLSFLYFQKCINPIFLMPLPAPDGGAVNTCAGAGCHANATGTGGAFRVEPGAQPVDLADPRNTPEVVRQSAMYKNFYSAQGEVVFGSPTQSRLLAKPRLLNVLHGGGQVFASDQDPAVRRIAYWISRPVPQGQDEFSAAGDSMFTPPNAKEGTCNTQ